MTNEIHNAFWCLRKCERSRIMQNMSYTTHQFEGETSVNFCERVVRQICKDGRLRELEEEIRNI